MKSVDLQFKKIVWNHYNLHKRQMPWRDDISPYSIFVSEIMLQQTQVSRVLKKYPEFLLHFPDFKTLATASTKEVLRVWQGMGYNRRALYMKRAAEMIMSVYAGILPNDPAVLDDLPGIGYATACSMAAFAYNIPVSFIETNIRRVFIHHYFADKEHIADNDILPHVIRTLHTKNPREWYWALMDYGAFLGQTIPNPNTRSKGYVRQSLFKGSVRQMRGAVLSQLLKSEYSLKKLQKLFSGDHRLERALTALVKEGVVMEEKGIYRIQ